MGSPGFGPRPGPYPSNAFPGPRPGFPGPRHPSSSAGPLPPQSPSTSAPVPSHLAGPPRPMVPPQRPHVSLGQEPQHEQVRVKLVNLIWCIIWHFKKKSDIFVGYFWSALFWYFEKKSLNYQTGWNFYLVILSISSIYRLQPHSWICGPSETDRVRGSQAPFIRDQIWSDPSIKWNFSHENRTAHACTFRLTLWRRSNRQCIIESLLEMLVWKSIFGNKLWCLSNLDLSQR